MEEQEELFSLLATHHRVRVRVWWAGQASYSGADGSAATGGGQKAASTSDGRRVATARGQTPESDQRENLPARLYRAGPVAQYGVQRWTGSLTGLGWCGTAVQR